MKLAQMNIPQPRFSGLPVGKRSRDVNIKIHARGWTGPTSHATHSVPGSDPGTVISDMRAYSSITQDRLVTLATARNSQPMAFSGRRVAISQPTGRKALNMNRYDRIPGA